MERELVERCLLTFQDRNVVVRQSAGRGLGVFAARTLSVGVHVGEFQGEIIGEQAAKARPNNRLLLELGSDTALFVDAQDEKGRTKYLCVGHYVNEPSPGETCNAALVVDTVNKRIHIRTIRAVEEGQEVLASYGPRHKRDYGVNEAECNKPLSHWHQFLPAHSSQPAGRSGQASNGLFVDQTPDGEPLCRLCGREATVSMGPIEEYSGNRVHRVCAIWASEVYEDPNTNELMDVDKACRRGRQLKCALCGQRGATIGCKVATCRLSYHYHCAQQARCVLDESEFVMHCPDHKPLAAQLVPSEHNPKMLGAGDSAWESFVRARFNHVPAHLSKPQLRSAREQFQLQVRSTPMVRKLRDATEVEACSTVTAYAGSWWDAKVLGCWQGIALVRFAGYRAEDDEWTSVERLRLPSVPVACCGAVEVGTKYSVFTTKQDWREARVVAVQRSSRCNNTDRCARCQATVKFASSAGEWRGAVLIVQSLPKRVAVLGARFQEPQPPSAPAPVSVLPPQAPMVAAMAQPRPPASPNRRCDAEVVRPPPVVEGAERSGGECHPHQIEKASKPAQGDAAVVGDGGKRGAGALTPVFFSLASARPPTPPSPKADDGPLRLSPDGAACSAPVPAKAVAPEPPTQPLIAALVAQVASVEDDDPRPAKRIRLDLEHNLEHDL